MQELESGQLAMRLETGNWKLDIGSGCVELQRKKESRESIRQKLR